MARNALAVCASARALSLVEQARTMLAEARDLNEVKEVIGKAEAIRHFLRQQGEAVEAQNLAAEIKVRAERRAGELLREMPKNAGAATRSHDVTASPPTLSDLGVERMQSSRFQAVASIPEPLFEEHIAATKASGKPLTSNGTLRLAKQVLMGDEPEPKAEPAWLVHRAVIELITTIRVIFDAWPEAKRPILGAKLRDIGEEILETGGMPE